MAAISIYEVSIKLLDIGPSELTARLDTGVGIISPLLYDISKCLSN